MKKQLLMNNYLIVVALAVAGLTLFSRTATNSFINFDDPTYITENSFIREGLTAQGIVWAFTSTYADNWHPLTWLSHMLDIEIFGLSPGGITS